jgi:hypothetical protein
VRVVAAAAARVAIQVVQRALDAVGTHPNASAWGQPAQHGGHERIGAIEHNHIGEFCLFTETGRSNRMADLKVDFSLLDSIERSLSSLHSEFQNIQVNTNAYDGAMGSGDVASAMDGFAGNWSDHRKNLISSMQSLGTMVSETIQQFKNADNKLASTLPQK